MVRKTQSVKEIMRSMGHLSIASTESVLELAKVTDLPHITYEQVDKWIGFPEDDDIFMLAHDMRMSFPAHTHNYYELSYVLSGNIVNVIGGKRSYLLEGTLCVMNLNSCHALEAPDPDAVLVNICLQRSLFESGIFRDFIEGDSVLAQFLRGETGNPYLVFSDIDTDTLNGMISAMVREYYAANRRQTVRLGGIALLLLDALAKSRAYSFQGLDLKGYGMLRYLREHCDTVTVGELARTFGYSENYCSQYLRVHTGLTATTLIANARMTRAEELLGTTSMPVDDIAHAVGYKSASHFYELFKRRHGMTPNDYRILGADLASFMGTQMRGV